MPEKRKIKKTSHHITTRQTKITTILVQRFLSSIAVLSLRASTRYFYPATVASGTGRKNKNKKNHVQNSS